ncbi:Homeobox-leucine zipper protein [Dirofilaria immitis]
MMNKHIPCENLNPKFTFFFSSSLHIYNKRSIDWFSQFRAKRKERKANDEFQRFRSTIDCIAHENGYYRYRVQ